uniref:Kinesin-like protein costa n=1 Tax=Glossina brevipalpis TaxID=37001 RepID=A0A1A9WR33_9MUSC
MEIPIQVAVRIFPKEKLDTRLNVDEAKNAGVNEDAAAVLPEEEKETKCCVQAIPLATNTTPVFLENGIGMVTGLIQAGPHSFPVTHALQPQCTQSQMYHQTIFPLVSLFMEGFDASVVTYGQRNVGKTYTLYGHGFDCGYSEADQGIVQRCAREIFAHIANHPGRTYIVNIGWVEICGEVIRDLLGVGNVHCISLTDVFHWLQVGLNTLNANRRQMVHSLFTLTLEQQWISKEGLMQHRLSTASFSDLAATERLFILNSLEQPSSLPKDLGLQSLEQVVSALIDPGANRNIPYNQTTLTTLLKDSFGGRAQTLLILCVSPFERDINETLCNLQFAFKVQCLRNYVVMNTFSDDNTPITPESLLPDIAGVTNALQPQIHEQLGLQFAASQWFKLVSNAEGLLSKLITSYNLAQLDKEQIEEWLFLKQECEECLSSNEIIRSQKQLGPIQEAEEPDEAISESETCQNNESDNESDSESQRPDLEEKMETLMEELSISTDRLVSERYQEFMETHPRAVMESQESLKTAKKEAKHSEIEERKPSVGGRRRSLQPGTTLSSAEIAMLNQVASRERQDLKQKQNDEFLDSSTEVPLRSHSIQKKVRKLDIDIEARLRQIKEVEETMQLKQNIIMELVKNSETRSTAKQKFHKKRAKLEAEYEKTKKSLTKAIVQGKEKQECERLKAIMQHLEQRLKDVTSIKHIAGESGQKIKKLQHSLQESKKMIEDLQKKVKKERKLKEALENELKNLKEKENSKALLKLEGTNHTQEEKGKHLKEMQARISHLDHVLREKSENLEQYGDDEQRETLRHEIRNLRRTRDHLLDQRCSLDRKLKRDKNLTQKEERKLLECDEAIEAIDAAIEFKNELICGHKSIDTSERSQREKGEQMLMARLNKLSLEEMRTMLYKYFNKVIDLRDSSRKLELQLLQLEREKDAWEWKERVLSNAVRQARLEGERNTVLLQRQHEIQKALILRHLVEETANSSASFTDSQASLGILRNNNLSLAANSTNSTAYSDTDSLVNHKIFKSSKLAEMEMCPLNDNGLSKYKPLDKFKEKGRETKNKLFKFQVLTRYTSAGQNDSVMNPLASTSLNSDDGAKVRKDKETSAIAIPQENLKKLATNTNSTKVTRQKNKIIIQDNSRKN